MFHICSALLGPCGLNHLPRRKVVSCPTLLPSHRVFSSLPTKQAPSVSRGRSACNPFLLRHPTHTVELQWRPDGRGWVGRDIDWRKLGKPGIQSHTPAEDIAMTTPQGPARLPGNSPRPSEEVAGGPRFSGMMMLMLGASQCVRTRCPCLWLGEWTWGSLCGRMFAGDC